MKSRASISPRSSLKGFQSVFALRNKIGFLLAVKKAGGDAARKEDEEEVTQEVTALSVTD